MIIVTVFYSREGPDMSGDNEKVFHRSLDLLQLWITDCKQVDFKPKSSLVDMLENFVNTEVFDLLTHQVLLPHNNADNCHILELTRRSASSLPSGRNTAHRMHSYLFLYKHSGGHSSCQTKSLPPTPSKDQGSAVEK